MNWWNEKQNAALFKMIKNTGQRRGWYSKSEQNQAAMENINVALVWDWLVDETAGRKTQQKEKPQNNKRKPTKNVIKEIEVNLKTPPLILPKKTLL